MLCRRNYFKKSINFCTKLTDCKYFSICYKTGQPWSYGETSKWPLKELQFGGFFYFFFYLLLQSPRFSIIALSSYLFLSKKLFLIHVFFLDMTYKRCNTVIPNKPQYVFWFWKFCYNYIQHCNNTKIQHPPVLTTSYGTFVNCVNWSLLALHFSLSKNLSLLRKHNLQEVMLNIL